MKGLAITGTVAQKNRQKTAENVSKWLDEIKVKKIAEPKKLP